MDIAAAEKYLIGPARPQAGTLDIAAFGGPVWGRWDQDARVTHWGGFVTQTLKPTRAMARLIALVANWWNVFCRLADGGKHMEAITSRPMLLGLVGRLVRSGRKRHLRLTSTHVESGRIRAALDRIGAFLRRISATAPQLDFNRKWTLILGVAFRHFLGGRPLHPATDGPQLLLPLPH